MKIYYFILTLFFCSISFAQSTISGSVKDSKNEPIPGANVKVVGEPSGTVTDGDGKFTYRSGETVEFYLGDLKLGESTGAENLNTYLITGTNPISSAADVIKALNAAPYKNDHAIHHILNISITLQSFDYDK